MAPRPHPKLVTTLSTGDPHPLPAAAGAGKPLDPLDLLNGAAISYGMQLARLWAAQATATTACCRAIGDVDACTRARAVLSAEQAVTDRHFDLLVAAAQAAAPHVAK